SSWAEENAYEAGIAQWRRQKEEALKADGGWLTVTGLFWLREGENRVEPAQGVFALHEKKTVFHPDHGPAVEMKTDSSVTVGAKTFILIERGDRYGVRLKDN